MTTKKARDRPLTGTILFVMLSLSATGTPTTGSTVTRTVTTATTPAGTTTAGTTTAARTTTATTTTATTAAVTTSTATTTATTIKSTATKTTTTAATTAARTTSTSTVAATTKTTAAGTTSISTAAETTTTTARGTTTTSTAAATTTTKASGTTGTTSTSTGVVMSTTFTAASTMTPKSASLAASTASGTSTASPSATTTAQTSTTVEFPDNIMKIKGSTDLGSPRSDCANYVRNNQANITREFETKMTDLLKSSPWFKNITSEDANCRASSRRKKRATGSDQVYLPYQMVVNTTGSNIHTFPQILVDTVKRAIARQNITIARLELSSQAFAESLKDVGKRICEQSKCKTATRQCVYNATTGFSCKPQCEVISDYCRNGGKCEETCQCPTGFTGGRCEQKVSDGGMSTEAIIGIAVGSGCALILVIVLVCASRNQMEARRTQRYKHRRGRADSYIDREFRDFQYHDRPAADFNHQVPRDMYQHNAPHVYMSHQMNFQPPHSPGPDQQFDKPAPLVLPRPQVDPPRKNRSPTRPRKGPPSKPTPQATVIPPNARFSSGRPPNRHSQFSSNGPPNKPSQLAAGHHRPSQFSTGGPPNRSKPSPYPKPGPPTKPYPTGKGDYFTYPYSSTEQLPSGAGSSNHGLKEYAHPYEQFEYMQQARKSGIRL